MAIFPGSAIPSAVSDYEIDNSLRFDKPNDSYLEFTPGSTSNRRTWTFSCWVKLSGHDEEVTLLAAKSNGLQFYVKATGELTYWENAGAEVMPAAKLRDPSAWYHIVLAVDTTQSTDTNRVKFYVNGEHLTDITTGTYPAEDHQTDIGNTEPQILGVFGSYTSQPYDGYMAEVYMINGQQLTPSDFGETNEDTNQWIPKDASSLTFGTNGFYLKFQDSAALGDDSSGNGNDFTVTNLVASDQMLDTPTNNFCTMNPLYLDNDNNGNVTWSEGNTKWSSSGSGGDGGGEGTIGVSSGKWYWEVYVNTISGTNGYFGAHLAGDGGYGAANFYYTTSAGKIRSAGETDQTGIATASAGDIVSIAIDLDASPQTGKVYLNNSQLGTTMDLIAGYTWTPWLYNANTSVTKTFTINCGQDSTFAGATTAGGNQDGNEVGDFKYAVPSGYLALCTSNLPEPAIVLPEPYFEMLTATGDGTSSKTWSGLEFQPDLVWAKDYDGTEQDADHQWMDVLRGADQILRVNLADAEVDGSTSLGSGSLRTFTSDGFTVQDGTTNNNNLNYSGDSIIAYNWKAGGTGVANTDGSISSTVSANTTSGFSMATFTSNVTAGATVGHGLTQAPEMIWSKIRDDGTSWVSGATSMADTTPWGWAWLLNHHHAWNNRDEEWNDTTPGASVFTLGSGGSNVGSHPVIAYCFHSVEGYSKIGYYYGNGNANGPFMYTGFRPSFVIFKGNGVNLHNHMLDNKRWTYNPLGVTLGPEPGLATDDAEVPSNEGSGHVDFLSNGFKIRSDNGNANDNTTRFIFIAFAESPFKYSNAR